MVEPNTGFTAVVTKVQRLLALSKSTNPHEAAAAAAVANKLMQEHRISHVELELSGAEPVTVVIEDTGPLYTFERDPSWRDELAHGLARHYGCTTYWQAVSNRYTSGRRTTTRGVMLVGRATDIETVRYMFAWLVAEFTRLGAKVPGADRRSYMLGCSHGVLAVLRENANALHTQAVAGNSAAMVLVNRVKEAEQALKTLQPNLRVREKAPSQVGGGGYHAGVQAGRAVHLGAKLGGGSNKLLGGKGD